MALVKVLALSPGTSFDSSPSRNRENISDPLEKFIDRETSTFKRASIKIDKIAMGS